MPHGVRDVHQQHKQLRAIVRSTWPACTAPDPEDPAARPFTAEAIIANPVLLRCCLSMCPRVPTSFA